MTRSYEVVVRSNRENKVRAIDVRVDGARKAAFTAACKASGFTDPHAISLRRIDDRHTNRSSVKHGMVRRILG